MAGCLLTPRIAMGTDVPLRLTVNGDAAESFRVNLWLKWSLFYSINESVSYLYISAAEPACSAYATTTSACCSTCVVCRFVNGRKMQWLTAARWLTAVM